MHFSPGVTLLLKTELIDYPTSGIAEDSGFVVDIHSPYALPDVYDSGFLVGPKTVTRVAVTTVSSTGAYEWYLEGSQSMGEGKNGGRILG